MKHYSQNAKWLLWLAPLDNLAISGAYIVPFFLQNGIGMARIMALQSIFSIAVILLEVPSGYFADKFGRAFSIKLSTPAIAIGLMTYGLGNCFWQFAASELLLAVAFSLASGADEALLFDSLKADGQEKEFSKVRQKINSFGFLAVAIGVPISFALVKLANARATIIADAIIAAIGVVIALRLVEAPKLQHDTASGTSVWYSTKELLRNVHARWVIVLVITLNAATYIGFWFTTPYYQKLGIPLTAFGALLAGRSLFKAWLSHKFHIKNSILGLMLVCSVLVGIVWLAMATGLIWLAWLVLGHDIVQVLHKPILTKQLNLYIASHNRATLNSVINLMTRLVFAVVGPVTGLAINFIGLSGAMVAIGVTCTVVSLGAVIRLHKLKAFSKGGD